MLWGRRREMRDWLWNVRNQGKPYFGSKLGSTLHHLFTSRCKCLLILATKLGMILYRKGINPRNLIGTIGTHLQRDAPRWCSRSARGVCRPGLCCLTTLTQLPTPSTQSPTPLTQSPAPCFCYHPPPPFLPIAYTFLMYI